MAIMDYRLEFCDATAISGSVGTTAFGNTIDLGVDSKNYGDGSPVYLHLRMKTVATSATSTATMAFTLQNATTNTAASFSDVVTLKAAAVVGTYVAGYKIYDASLPSGSTLKRYLRLSHAIAGTPITAGQVDAYMSLDPR